MDGSLQAIVKHSGGIGFIVSTEGKSYLIFVEERLNGPNTVSILENRLLPIFNNNQIDKNTSSKVSKAWRDEDGMRSV